MNQGDRHRRRNRFERRAEGRARRWIPVVLVAALLAFLLWFPFRGQPDGSVSFDSVSSSMAKQVTKEHAAAPEGAGATEVSKSAAHDDPAQEAISDFGGETSGAVLDATPDVVVINSSVEEMNTRGLDEDMTGETSQVVT